MVLSSEKLTVSRQCELLGLNRTTFYYKPKLSSAEQMKLAEHIKARIDYWHTKMCYLGKLKLKQMLNNEGVAIGKDLIGKYMYEMGIYAVYPKPNLSIPDKLHKKFPYLLKGLSITRPNQVWAVDITYVKMGKTHMYLTAIIDWYSRFIVGYELSDTLETAPILWAIKAAIAKYGKPGIINSDQGSQFTSEDYVRFLKANGIQQSMDGKARWVDNVIIERWFRSLKCDYLYITEHNTPKELRAGITGYIEQYNNIRPHQSHEYKCPITVYKAA